MNTLKELRKALGLTQSEFAEKIAMAQQGVSMAENGTRPLTDRQVVTICAVFGVDEHWLRTGEGDMFPPLPAEDDELIELMGMFASDDVDPERKRAIISYCRLVLRLPDYALEPTREYFERLTAALDAKNTED